LPTAESQDEPRALSVNVPVRSYGDDGPFKALNITQLYARRFVLRMQVKGSRLGQWAALRK
jgi:hypothetical protein